MPKIYFKINATLLVMNNLRNQETLTKFGIRLKEIRNRRGLTLEQLAFDADIELSQVHRVEKGKINPTLTTLIALAKGLGITLAELVGE
jgi:transcriptional regulator with XRE-family HTH domain